MTVAMQAWMWKEGAHSSVAVSIWHGWSGGKGTCFHDEGREDGGSLAALRLQMGLAMVAKMEGSIVK